MYMIKTHLTKVRDYDPDEVVRIVNPKQQKLYIKHKVYPIDIYHSIDGRGEDVIVCVFLREETKDLYNLWQEFKLS